MDTTTYTYDDADRLTTVTPPSSSAITYTWDDNGDLTDRGSDAVGWDYEDRLVEATFAYRGDGLRDSRTVGSSITRIAASRPSSRGRRNTALLERV